AVADDRQGKAAVEPEVDQPEGREREAEGPGDEGGSDQHDQAAQRAVDVALAVEVAAAAERAGLDGAGRSVAPGAGGHLAALAAVRTGKLAHLRRQLGAEREAAIPALRTDAQGRPLRRGRPSSAGDNRR